MTWVTTRTWTLIFRSILTILLVLISWFWCSIYYVCTSLLWACTTLWYLFYWAEDQQKGISHLFAALCIWAHSFVFLCMFPLGGRLSWSDGKSLSSADLPSQSPLSVEETRPTQEEASGLVSVFICAFVCGVCMPIIKYVSLFLLSLSVYHLCVISFPFRYHGKICCLSPSLFCVMQTVGR